MPNIEEELCNNQGIRHFSSSDFCAGYWQCRLTPELYDAFRVIALEGSVVSSRVLHGSKNDLIYF